MTITILLFNLLKNIGNLPDELIVKIIYDYNGMRHPIVTLLLNHTRNDEHEILSSRPYTKNLIRYFNTFGHSDHLTYLILKEQKEYINQNNINYGVYKDIEYFLPRTFGKLYYNEKNEKLTMFVKDWNLNLSKKKLENIKCMSCNYCWFDVNKHTIWDSPKYIRFSNTHIMPHSWSSVFDYFLEFNYVKNKNYLCKHCFSCAFN